jgi:hypothetical protein
VTYGMTDDEIPTPIPASSATGSANTGAACLPPSGVTTTAAISIAAASPSMPRRPGRLATRSASTMYSANSSALANANATPRGAPANRTPVSS